MQPARAQPGQHGLRPTGVGQPQHHAAAALRLGPGGDQRQPHLIRRRNQTRRQCPVMRGHCAQVLPRMPVQRGQRGGGGHDAGCAIVEAPDVGRIGEFVQVPGKRVLLTEPAPQFGLTVGDQGGCHMQNARPRRAAHPFQAGGQGEIHRWRRHAEGQKPCGLGDIHPDQRSHRPPMRHQRIQIDPVGRG